jgi:GNAT superfamily N-acetyltransferase
VDVSIRQAVHSDVEALQDLIARSVRLLSIAYYSPQQIERSIVALFGVDSKLIEDETYYVAQIGGEIVGCGGWSKRSTMYGGDQAKSAEETEIDPRSSPARIRAFFVDPKHARKGVGRAILAHCERAAILGGFRSAELVATLPGEPLYAALGYKAVEPVDVDLGDGQTLPCKRMTKALVSCD